MASYCAPRTLPLRPLAAPLWIGPAPHLKILGFSARQWFITSKGLIGIVGPSFLRQIIFPVPFRILDRLRRDLSKINCGY